MSRFRSRLSWHCVARELDGCAVSHKLLERHVAAESEELSVSAYKKDVYVSLFGLAWYPFHMIQVPGRLIGLPAYGHKS